MLRERALKVVVVLLGLFFCAGIYPIAEVLWHPDAAEDYGDYMMLSLYVTLGVFLLIAARNPSAHRSLIAFTAWSSSRTPSSWARWPSSLRTSAWDFCGVLSSSRSSA